MHFRFLPTLYGWKCLFGVLLWSRLKYTKLLNTLQLNLFNTFTCLKGESWLTFNRVNFFLVKYLNNNWLDCCDNVCICYWCWGGWILMTLPQRFNLSTTGQIHTTCGWDIQYCYTQWVMCRLTQGQQYNEMSCRRERIISALKAP